MFSKRQYRPIFIVLACWAALPAWAGTLTGKVEARGARDSSDVVVYLSSVPGTFPPPREPAIIDQKKMVFIPHVLPIVKGTTVKFLNSDDVLHNVFTPSKTADRFNLGTWPKGATKQFTFTRAGEAVLLCNVHPEMEAYVIVLDNPFFALTEKDGQFRIDNIPAGTYMVKTWHEKLKPSTATVTVPAQGTIQLNLTVTR